MSSEFQPAGRTLPLTTVEGSIQIVEMAPSCVIGIGTLSGGCLGVQYSLQHLRDAIDAAIARLYPLGDSEDAGACSADIQIVHPNYGIVGPTAPMLLISRPREGAEDVPCVMVAGIIPDLDNPRIVRDAVEAREVD